MIRTRLISADTIRLLRIPFSLYLMPVFLLALSQAEVIRPTGAIISFIIIHLLIYPASNGYNSYVDRDEGSIGGLEHPPLPTQQLFYTTVILDLVSIVAGALLVGTLFAACLMIYVTASRAYSSPRVRLKKHPWAGFFTVAVFQGAFTYYMAYTGINGKPPLFSVNEILIMLACSCQIAGAYPLTQIYQHEEDERRGDHSLSLLLGHRGTFMFSSAMFALCAIFYALYFGSKGSILSFFILQLFFLPALLYFFNWSRKVRKDPSEAGFRQTMRMNRLASLSMSACFLFFLIMRLRS